jgi:hypothetical protein
MIITMALLIILILLALLALLFMRGRRAVPSRAEQQNLDDELIAVVLPTIKNDK